jgi:hypothetical protein
MPTHTRRESQKQERKGHKECFKEMMAENTPNLARHKSNIARTPMNFNFRRTSTRRTLFV